MITSKNETEGFYVELDPHATSPNPHYSIWDAQHQCVSEYFVSASHDRFLNETESELGVIKHQLAGDRGHYSVLNAAFLKFNCHGFPHSVLAQVSRHESLDLLVQSNRYTGNRFVKVANQEVPVKEVFYFRQPGKYKDRSGNTFEYTDILQAEDIVAALKACEVYRDRVALGCPYEMARGMIPYDFRQDFTIMGTLRDFFHMIDQRSSKASQEEIQQLSKMIFECIERYTPEIAKWYKDNRFGKARLAP